MEVILDTRLPARLLDFYTHGKVSKSSIISLVEVNQAI